jgi:hypothetical protein
LYEIQQGEGAVRIQINVAREAREARAKKMMSDELENGIEVRIVGDGQRSQSAIEKSFYLYEAQMKSQL